MPLRDAAQLIREISDAGLSRREGCGNTVRNVTGDPWAGVCEDELFDPTPYAGAYVRYFVRHPTTQLMPRKVKTAFTAHRRGPRDHRHPRHRLHRRASATASAASRSASAAARRSCRASRRRSTSSSSADDGEYLKVAEAVFRIFDRQDWLRVNRARARIKVLVDKFGIDELRKQVEEELQGRLGRRARLRRRRRACSSTTRRPPRPAVPATYALAQRRPARSSSASRASQRQPPAPGRLLDRRRSTSRAAT